MSNRSKGRRRGIPGWRPGDIKPMTPEQVSSALLDGLPCPYCARRTFPDQTGLWACECGWSGAFVAACSDPTCGA